MQIIVKGYYLKCVAHIADNKGKAFKKMQGKKMSVGCALVSE